MDVKDLRFDNVVKTVTIAGQVTLLNFVYFFRKLGFEGKFQKRKYIFVNISKSKRAVYRSQNIDLLNGWMFYIIYVL